MLIQENILTHIDSTIQTLPDTILVSGSIEISDTLRIIDAGKYSEYPLSFIAVVVAIFAILIPPFIRWKNEYSHRKNLRKYTLNVSNSLILSYDNKIKIFRKLAKQIENIDEPGYAYTRSMGYIAQNLLNIPQNDHFRVFVSRRKSKASQDYEQFKELFDAIAFFANHDEEGQTNFSQFFSDIRRHEDRFQINLNLILRLNDRYVSFAIREGIKPSKYPFLGEIDQIFDEWSTLKNHESYSITESKLLKPLKAVTIKYRGDKRAIQMLELIIECNSAIFKIRDTKKVYSKVYRELAKILKKKRDSMTTAINYFEQPRWIKLVNVKNFLSRNNQVKP